MKAFDIPTLDESLRLAYEAGKINAREVARQLYLHRWKPYIPDDDEALERIHAK